MLLGILVLGIATGMRTMTPIAVFCWFMFLARGPVTGWTFWTANLISVAIFSLAAAGEYVGDTLPQTPSRTSAFPLGARIVFGGLVGSLAASMFGEPLAGGVIVGVVGALIGSFAGVRTRLTCSAKVGKDLPVALGESFLALVMSVAAMHLLCLDVVKQQHEAMLRFR